MVCGLIAAAIIASVGVRAQSGEPGDCPNDSKLLNDGPTAVFGEGAGTFWGLVIDGLSAAGFTDEDDQIAYLSQVFGMDFFTLEEAKDYNLKLVEEVYDKNRNGYVCAFELRGTRAYLDDPLVDITFFGVGESQSHS